MVGEHFAGLVRELNAAHFQVRTHIPTAPIVVQHRVVLRAGDAD